MFPAAFLGPDGTGKCIKSLTMIVNGLFRKLKTCILSVLKKRSSRKRSELSFVCSAYMYKTFMAPYLIEKGLKDDRQDVQGLLSLPSLKCSSYEIMESVFGKGCCFHIFRSGMSQVEIHISEAYPLRIFYCNCNTTLFCNLILFICNITQMDTSSSTQFK